MSDLSRRSFTTLSAGFVLGSASKLEAADVAPAPHAVRTEAPFERDYPPPEFTPSWRRPQINKLMVQDFVVFSHMDLPMVKRLLAREPGLLNASIDWGGGDWESGLAAASHMGRHDIIEFLLEKGARADIFCAAAMGMTDVVKAFLTLQPNLIDARGPHGFFNLHVHAQMGGERSAKTLEYLQSVKKLELKPFMKKK